MLTGTRAFEGEDITDVLAFIITREPDWRALPQATPPSVRKLLSRCLEKDRKKRLADVADARFELEDAATTPSSIGAAMPAGAGGASRRRLFVTAAWALATGSLISAAAAVLARVALASGSASGASVRFSLFTVSTPTSGVNFSPSDHNVAISPDGGLMLAYVGSDRIALRQDAEYTHSRLWPFRRWGAVR